MNHFNQKSFSLPYRNIIIDEIALEGLEGIGIHLLWKRIEKRIGSPVTEKLQNRFWETILKSDSIYLYENPVPVLCLDIIDRFTIIDESSGDLKEPDDYLDGPYEYHPVDDDNGSCVHYKKRRLLDKNTISQIPYKDLLSTYNKLLVLVASKEERWAALAPHLPMTYVAQLTKIHYCILELIGRSRENGQMTVGKTNLAKVVKDSKLLFYNRKILQNLDIVRVSRITQVVANKGGSKGILLRLRRFHQSYILSVPKIGWIHNLIQYLKQQPNYCESTETVLKKGLLTQKQNKRFQKKFYIFGFEEKPININEMAIAKKKEKPHKKRRYIYLSSITDDESSESEEEENKLPMKCQYKVGINLLRQAYERFLEAGLLGLTQIQLGELLGIEFYVSRTICRLFKTKNIVREFLEDKGRQRTARFIAVATTAKMDIQYAKEKEKFLKYVDECANLSLENDQLNDSASDSDNVVPRKKPKLADPTDIDSEDEDAIIEMKQIQGLAANPLTDSSKKLTLRQLKFASGILKIIRDKNVVIGYQELSKLVAAETKEPPMDSKALKTFLQRLVMDDCIKIIGIKWPGYHDKYTTAICAPNIKSSHPIIKAKYNDIVRNCRRNIEQSKRNIMLPRPLTRYSFPRYMKLQRLHEAMTKYAYFDDVKVKPKGLPPGFVYIKDFILELTLEVALGTISNAGVRNIAKFKVDDDLLKLKLRDLPGDIRKALMLTNHLNNSVQINIKVLATFGLVQLVAQVTPSILKIPDNSLSVNYFYVNKNATILDTSGVWPKRNVSNQILEKKFNFNTFEDVKDYWSTVFNISTNTTIDIPNRRQKKLPPVPIRMQNDVEQYDIGLRFGDNLGPCGFDSNFYLDLQRLWRAYCARGSSGFLERTVKKTVIKIPKFERTKKKVQRINKKTIQKSRLIEKHPNIKKSFVKKALLRQPIPDRKKVFSQVKWTLEDDTIIMLCNTAIAIMSPISQPGFLQVRNLVTKDILSIRDPKKNQKLCHRRAAFVDANSTMIHKKDCIMAELKYHSSIMQKYEGMLKKIRLLHNTNNLTKYILSARVPMMELVWILMDVLKCCISKQNVPMFANIEEFRSKFIVVPSSANRPGNSYKSDPDDFLLGPLKEAIILTVMLSFKNIVLKESGKKIFQNFKRYDEKILRKAVTQLRHCGAMAAKDKILNGILHKVSLDDIVDCWYRVSALYQRKWQIRLNAVFADDLFNFFDKPNVVDDIKASPDVNCFCSEMQVIGVLDIMPVIAPVISGFTGNIMQEDQLNAIDIESKYKLKSGSFGWKVRSDIENISSIYENIDIEEPLQMILRESVMNQDLKNIETNYEKLDEIERKIIEHIKNKREHGCKFYELKEISGLKTKNLIETLTKLTSQNTIKRVGVYDNIIILVEYIDKWSMEVNSYYILSKPWLTIDAEIRKNVFLKWASVVMNKVFECPGCNIPFLSDCCEFLSTASVQDVCEVLCKWKCVKLHTLIEKEPDLFSEDDDITTEFVDYNMYESPQNIVVLPVADSLVRYSFIRKTILNSLSTSS